MRFLWVLPLLAIGGCGKSPEAAAVERNADLLADDMEMQADNMDAMADAASSPTDLWQMADDVDAITDARLITADSKVVGRVNDVQISVTCSPTTANLSYKIHGFDKDGDGARLDTSFTDMGMLNSVIFRPDSRPAQRSITIKPQYTNETTIVDEDAFSAASAKILTLRIQFGDANETYFLDQDSDNFRRTVKPCYIARRSALDSKREAEVQAAAVAASEARPASEETPEYAPRSASEPDLVNQSNAL